MGYYQKNVSALSRKDLEELYEKVRVHCEDLFARSLLDDELYGVDILNAGASIAATELRRIAETGEHKGVFGSYEMELAAQAILKLHGK